MTSELQKVVIICGPTCVGKTRVGIELAKKFRGEIISADSAAVYKELEIGTAKPTQSERAEIPHHLIDVSSPAEQFDVAKFVELADAAIKDISAKGKVPFIVGGTGLYIKALLYGLAEAPPRDEAYRKELEALKKEKGTPYLYKMLVEKDPNTALKLKANDSTRVMRALEVLHVTGCSISEFQKGHGFKDRRYDYLKIGLNVDRKELYRRIDERVDRMIASGLEGEVRLLVEKYGSDAPVLKAVGYRELVDVVARNAKHDEAISVIKLNTHHFAKRQLTWFRADKEIKWFAPSEISEMASLVAAFQTQNLTAVE